MAKQKENRAPNRYWADLCLFLPPHPRAQARARGRQARHSARYIMAFRDCWSGSLPKIQLASRTPHPSSASQNTFEVQPVFALHLWEKWYLRSAEANWTMGSHRHSPTMLPLSLDSAVRWCVRDYSPMSLFVTGQWMVYRQFAPVAPLDDDKLRSHGGIPPAAILLGWLEFH